MDHCEMYFQGIVTSSWRLRVWLDVSLGGNLQPVWTSWFWSVSIDLSLATSQRLMVGSFLSFVAGVSPRLLVVGPVGPAHLRGNFRGAAWSLAYQTSFRAVPLCLGHLRHNFLRPRSLASSHGPAWVRASQTSFSPAHFTHYVSSLRLVSGILAPLVVATAWSREFQMLFVRGPARAFQTPLIVASLGFGRLRRSLL